MFLQTIHDMMKQAKAGKMVLEDDIPPPVAVPASRHVPAASAAPHSPAEPSAAPARQAPVPASIEIPRPAVVGVGGPAAAVPPVAKSRTNVEQAGGSGAAAGARVNVAQSTVNASPVPLHSGPASTHPPTDTGTLYFTWFTLVANSNCPLTCYVVHTHKSNYLVSIRSFVA